MKKREGYSPLPVIVQDKIFTAWESYRSTFGLEGEELYVLIQAGVSGDTIIEQLQKIRAIREELLPLWENEWFTQNKV